MCQNISHFPHIPHEHPPGLRRFLPSDFFGVQMMRSIEAGQQLTVSPHGFVAFCPFFRPILPGS